MISDNKEWLGEMPKSWNIVPIGNIYYERKNKTTIEDTPLSVTKNGVIPQLKHVVKSSEGSERKVVKQGDFVINSRSDRKGACGIAKENGTCSVINIVLSGINNDVRFFDYVLLTENFSNEFYRWGHGIASDLWTTKWQQMKKILLPLPSLNEQIKIVNFLNEKCKNIDFLIEKEEKNITQYKKIKNQMIEKYIFGTKENYKTFKSSKHNGIPDIPEHWNEMKLKRIFKIKKNIAGREGLQLLSITQNGIIKKDISKNEGQMAMDYSGYQIVDKGDFAMNHMDLLTGWVDISDYNGVTSPDYRVFYIQDEKSYNSYYYLYFLQYCYTKQIFYSMTQGVSEFGRSRLKADKFLNMYIPVPPIEEQRNIANILVCKIGNIDNIIKKKRECIITLKKYKKSMIYEYVTGKKEVV